MHLRLFCQAKEEQNAISAVSNMHGANVSYNRANVSYSGANVSYNRATVSYNRATVSYNSPGTENC